VASYASGQADVSAKASTWTAGIAYLHAHLGPSYRVEAVDTSGHWPAVYLADAGIPLARGWFRQDDFPQNEVLYSKLGAASYLHWLRGLGVRYVVLTTAPPDYSAKAEAALVGSGRAGLQPVFTTSTLTIYEVPHAQSIVTGPDRPRLDLLTQQRIGVAVRTGGDYRIAVRWSPYWRTSDGCLSETKDNMMQLRTRAARRVTITLQLSLDDALDELAGASQPKCSL
jgi:hypothetical protein